jgi:LmbE family N-acetylglucosaminyl deacetylase
VRNRQAEDRAVLEGLGCRAVHLPLLDGQYRAEGSADSGQVVGELRRLVPAASRVYAAAGIGDHPDHVIVRDAGAALAASGVPAGFYADYSYCTRHGWPSWVDGGGSAQADEQWRRALGRLLGPALERPRLRRLSVAESDAKLQAMRGYVTQFASIEAEEPRWQEDGLPPSHPEKRTLEVFYDAAP